MAVTVTVACKLPHGLILRLFDMVDIDEPVAGGGYRTVKRAQPRGDRTVMINGYLTRLRGLDIAPAAPGSSFAMTSGVDKEFFEEWVKQNADHPAVVNGLIYANEKADAVSGHARERKDQRCGMEPINREKLPKGIDSAQNKAA